MLFGIKKISWCYWDALTCSRYHREIGICTMPTNAMTEICLSSQNQAKLSIQISDQSRVKMYSADVRFMSEDDLQDSRAKCYLIETVEGSKYIIGGKERPFATMTVDLNVAASPTELSGTSYVISYKSAQPILSVV